MKKLITLVIFVMAGLCSLSGCAKESEPKLLNPTQFGELIQTDASVKLIDVRTPDEFSASHIPGAVNVNALDDNFVKTIVSEFSKNDELALYCRSGHRSAEAAEKLRQTGYAVADLAGGILAWQQADLPLTADGIDYYYTKSGKTIKIEPLIHASIRITFGDMEIEVDPVGKLGDRSTDYSKFPKADLILITHEHHDHLDPEAVKTLSKADTLVIANKNSADILGYGKVMSNGDKISLGNDVKIEAVPAYNTSADRLQFHPKGRDNGYVLSLENIRIYIAGDTEVTPEMSELNSIDIAFLPCNLPYTMTPAQLIEAAKIIKPKVLYPYHYGTTDLSSITPALAPEGIYVRICPFDP